MTPRELDDKLTPLDIPSVWNALLLKWETLGVPPKRHAIELKLAHIHLETGLKSCHNYNLGNIKSRAGDGRHWQYFACGEEVAEHTLDEVMALEAKCVTIKARYQRNAAAWASLWITPKHPWTKFAAFETLNDGIDAQLTYLRSPKRQSVLAAIQTGDPVAYNDALVANGYYTAGKAQYLATLQQRLAMVKTACANFNWGDVV